MGLERIASPVAFSTFRGLNKKLSSVSISSREATLIQNYILTQETLQVRSPFSRFTTSQLIESSTAKAVTGITQAVLGTTLYRVMTGGTKIKSCSSAGVLTDITGAVTLTDSQNNLMSFAKFKDGSANDILIGTNGVNAPWKWTGSGNAALLGGTPPANFKYIIVHKNRLWGTSGEFLYHSDLLDGETWDALYWVARFSSQGIATNEITGVGILGDNLVVFKEDKISMIAGESIPEAYIQDVVTGQGAISGASIVPIKSNRYGNILVFVNKNLEVKGFNGTKDLISLSDPIDVYLNTFNTSRSLYVPAVNWSSQKQYLCAMSRQGSGENNTLFGYDYYLDGFDSDPEGRVPIESTWMVFNGISANTMSIWDFNGVETLIVGTYDGWLLKYDPTAKKDTIHSSEINSILSGGGFLVVTTVYDHNFTIGNTITISGSSDSSLNGSYTIYDITSSNQFICSIPIGGVVVGTGGLADEKNNIRTIWQSKRHAFGNAALLKQLNDFNLVTVASSSGQVKVTVNTNQIRAIQTITAQKSGAVYGGTSLYGATSTYGSTGVAYNPVVLDTPTGLTGVLGRYFQVRIENVNGYIFGLEEYIMGVTSHGYQAEVQVA